MAKGIKLTPDQLKGLQEMLQKENEIRQVLENNQKELASIQEMMDESNHARIEVTGEVFAGTKICISDVSMVVKNSMTYCRFVKEQGDVKMGAL